MRGRARLSRPSDDTGSMNLIDRISAQFEDNMRTTLEALELLAAPIAGAVELITASLLDNGKVLVCGGSGCAGDARRFAAQLVNGFELERPSLAALALSADTSTLAPLTGEPDAASMFARQIHAFGHPGDILITLSTGADSARIEQAIHAAHERDMTVVILSGRTGGKLAALVRETDVLISVPHDRAARVREVHALVLHCLCDGVDAQLLGEQEIPQ